MVNVIKLGSVTSINRMIKAMKGVRSDIPIMSNKLMMQWGKTLERDVKTVGRVDAKIQDDTGELFGKGIEWRQKEGKNTSTGYLFIRNYGIRLDSMKPHWVNITTNRTRLLSWAKHSRTFKEEARLVEKGDLKSYAIYVRPHPFIRKGFNRARKKLRPMLNEKLKLDMKNV